MSLEQNHIIEKVFLEVYTPREKEGHRIQNEVSSFMHEEIFSSLDEFFNACNLGENVIRFEKLEIECSVSAWDNREEVKHELINAIKKKINNAINTADNSKDKDIKQPVRSNENRQATFLYFIWHGYLPWFGKHEHITEISKPEKWIRNLANKSFLSSLNHLLRNEKTAVERLVLQFPDEHILEFLTASKVINITDRNQFLHFLEQSEMNFRNSLLSYFVATSVDSSKKKECLIELVKTYANVIFGEEEAVYSELEVIPKLKSEMQLYFAEETISKLFPLSKDQIHINKKNANTVDVKSTMEANETVISDLEIEPTILKDKFDSDTKEPPFFDTGMKNILVGYAGLVLLGPFLPTYFRQFNWISKNGKIKQEALVKTAQAIHFLATGKEDFFEANLIFEKFLCGLPLNTPIPQKSMLNNEMKEEADNLLRQVIHNWPELKNTSPDGLRQMFVHRDGKLIKAERGFKLIVERKVQDVLMDNLQWNISIVKLPWKDDLLFVEW